MDRVSTGKTTTVSISGSADLVSCVGDDVETIHIVLDRAHWVLVALAVPFLFWLPETDVSVSLLLGSCVGTGGGVVLASYSRCGRGELARILSGCWIRTSVR
jgi:hypothetical protein